jgi:hypothetical protein
MNVNHPILFSGNHISYAVLLIGLSIFREHQLHFVQWAYCLFSAERTALVLRGHDS